MFSRSYTSEQKVDPLLIKLSQAAGYSLLGWADAWSYPVATATRTTLASLPVWDYDATLTNMEKKMNPTVECYTTPDKAWTEVDYQDPLIGGTMWYHSDYRGTVSQSSSGKTCIAWNSAALITNGVNYRPDKYNCLGLEGGHNYCRMAGDSKPWCYTSTAGAWEYCTVPQCTQMISAGSFSPTKSPR